MESHLLQMRGLKPGLDTPVREDLESHLLQMRGLKQKEEGKLSRITSSHLLQMRGLKHRWAAALEQHGRRIFYRCVD